MRNLPLLLILLLSVACADKYVEETRTEPPAQQGAVLPFMHSSEAGVAANLIASAILLGASRASYQSTAITGLCVCKNSAKDAIQLPCSSDVEVILTDKKGKELAKTAVAKGEFAFRVSKGAAYRVRISSRKFSPTTSDVRDLHLGDDVVIHLVRKGS